jgi:hypothetical protein
MSRSKNTIDFSNVSTTPVKLKYSASYADSDFGNVGISVVRGINIPVTSSVKVPQFKINYNLMEQLFYRGYISGSLLKSGSAYNSSYQSTAASGSLDEDVRFFPTESNAQVAYLYIPRQVFGEQIARKSFLLSTPRYYIYDDGNGNLIDGYFGVKVGNIIYSQAFAIITNPDYVCYFVNPEFDFSLEEGQSDVIVPSVTPSVSATPSVTPSISISPTVTPSITITPTVSKTPGASTSVTPSPTTTPSVTRTPSVSVSSTVSVTPSVTVSVTPSVTVSVTPTVTPSVSQNYYYYDVTQYLCSTCTPQIALVIRATSPLTVGKYYLSTQPESYSYLIDSVSAGTSWDIEPTSYVAYNTCTDACNAGGGL